MLTTIIAPPDLANHLRLRLVTDMPTMVARINCRLLEVPMRTFKVIDYFDYFFCDLVHGFGSKRQQQPVGCGTSTLEITTENRKRRVKEAVCGEAQGTRLRC
ncbi:MAG: hypothetical protein R3C68_08545 [Myxococcota bacterium]